MDKFEEFKFLLNECIHMDAESGHWEADKILKDMVISASKSELNTTQVLDLIDLWNKVHKWYA